MRIQSGKLIFVSNSDERYSNFICMYLIVFSLNLFFKLGLSWPESVYASIILCLKGILIVYLAYTVFKCDRKFIKAYCLCFTIIGAFFFKSMLIGKVEIGVLLNNYIDMLTIYIPLFACSFAIQDKKVLLNKIINIKFSGVLALLTCFTMIKYSMISVHNYDSSSAYILLIAAFSFFFRYKNDEKLINVIISGVLCVIAFIFGSRGTLICIIGFFIMQLFTKKEITYKKILFYLVLIFLFCFCCLNINWVLSLIPGDFQTRNLSIITQTNSYVTDIADSNGRIEVWRYYWDLAMSHKFIGSGVFGDYIDLYPHNIVIEILAAEGVIVGTVIVCWLLYKQIIPLNYIKTKNAGVSLYMIFSVAFFEVLFSTDFLLNELWWIFLGICFSMNHPSKYILRNSIRF